jgi:hypothetical protein
MTVLGELRVKELLTLGPALTRIGFGHVSHALLFNPIALACQ